MEKSQPMEKSSSSMTNAKKGRKMKKKGRKGRLPTSLTATEEPAPVIYRYGWGRFTPNWLQWFHKPIFLLCCMWWMVMTQGFIANGILRAAPTQIERRFHLLSHEIGLIDSMTDIGGLVTLLPLAHWGGNIHKGRWIAIGTLVSALGSLMCAVPHLAAGKFEPGIREEQHCIRNSSNIEDPVEHGKQWLSNWKYMFFFSQFLHGVGSSPYYAIGVTYLDENVSQKSSSVYVASLYAAALIGPLLGYMFFLGTNKIYGDFDKVRLSQVKINEKDPRWYGAWWTGAIVSCCSALLSALVMSGFGRQLPGAAEARKADVDQAHQVKDEDASLTEGSHLAGCMADFSKLWRQTKMLIKNSTYMLLILAHICFFFVTSGFASFVAKYIQTQFAKTSTQAALFVGLAVLPAAFFGVVVGGGVQRIFHLHCRGNLILSMATMVATVCASLGFFMICPNPNFAGVTVPYPSYPNEKDLYPLGKVEGKDLKKECNSNCGCKEEDFQPVCYSYKENNETIKNTSTLIFSPCYAGCVFVNETQKRAWNCSCISEDEHASVKYGICESECPNYKFVVFMIGFSLTIFFGYVTVTPMRQAMLRCVPFDLRTFSMALGLIFIRLLGPIPGGPIVGALFNVACILWQNDHGEKVCLLYDNKRVGYILQFLAIVGFSLCSLILGVAWRFYKSAPTPDKKPPESKPGIDLKKSPDIKVIEKSFSDVAVNTSGSSMIEKQLKSSGVQANLD